MSKELEALEKIKKASDIDYEQCVEDVYKEEIEIIKTALKDFEWLKGKLNLTFLESLSNPEDKVRVLKIMGLEYDTKR